MDFSRYLIATDLDGTFLGSDGKFVERNIKAVARFQAGGGLFTFSTGRVHLNIREAIGDPRKLLNAPCVMSNGGYLYDFQENLALEGELMAQADVEALITFIKARYPDLQFRVSTPTDLRVESTDRYMARDLRRYDEGTVLVSPALTWPTDDWYKIVFRGEPGDMQSLRAALIEAFGERLSLTASDSRFLEVQAPTVNKAAGLAKLRRICGSDRILIACGDYENDLEMLRAADIAICPANAMPEVKAIADYTLCHCSEGLIGDIVDMLERGEIKG
ncbi:MAG: hypothetical protein E7585_04030 [Ruminococcaceae bacterium]|nr:hypothetical protein [Oscillospiraceae bacterium]